MPTGGPVDARAPGSPDARRAALARLGAEDWDVLVVGGGVTGLGVALDAATRGLRTALVERDDLASGTSSKSSKLIHGGLRYLQQGEIGLVYEALHERRRLQHNAPHLVELLPFMIPVLTRDGVVSRRIARALGSALWMYDLTGGWRIGKFHRRLRARAALALLPTMPADRLASAYLYYDATADDARLCVDLARTAVRHGAAVCTRAAVTAIAKDAEGRAAGATVCTAEGREIAVRARVVVNATGVWVDDVLTQDAGRRSSTVTPAKGVHLTVPWTLVRNEVAVVIPVPGDKRSLFVIPWLRNADGTWHSTYVGTTDTPYDGPREDPPCDGDDVDYVLRALNAAVTARVERTQVTGVWSGLRPLVRDGDAPATGRTADLSRRHRLVASASGVVTITGGKLTTYRKMAERTVDLACRRLGVRRRCATRRLVLDGADRAGALDDLAARDPRLAAPLVPGLPYRAAEAVYAVTHEWALTLDDVFARRTRARLVDRRASAAHAEPVARLLAPHLGWDEAEIGRQVAAYRASCEAEERAGDVRAA